MKIRHLRFVTAKLTIKLYASEAKGEKGEKVLERRELASKIIKSLKFI